MVEKKVVYFERPGRANTDKCLEIVKGEVGSGMDGFVVVASTVGDTGLMFSDAFGEKVVVVTHSAGFKEPNTIEMPGDVRDKIEATGAHVYTGTMITHALETAFISKFGGVSTSSVVAQSLRRFGEGTKVCCEIVMMAVDAGLIPEGKETLAVAGTARGADTVLLIRSAASKRFLDLRVLEVLAKPRL